MSNWIACSVCFVITGGERTPATDQRKGYPVCAKHIATVERPDFDIFKLRRRFKAAV